MIRSFDDYIRELIPVCSKCGSFILDANVGDEDLVCKSCVREEKLDDLLDE